jgi:hypothetical protein
VRFSAVTLQPPSTAACRRLTCGRFICEENTDDPEPIEWMLLTTVPVHTFDDAVERAEWYAARWGIEVFHRTLKSGCRIKDRQLGTATRLQACLGIDMVVAWRIYHLAMLGREVPDQPCTVFFEEVEWKALHCYHYQTSLPPDEPPSMAERSACWRRWAATSDVAATARPAPRSSGAVCSISTWPSRCTSSSPAHLRLESGAPTPRGICRPPGALSGDGVK